LPIGSITLGQPISSDKPFATVEDSTSDLSRGGEVTTNIVGLVERIYRQDDRVEVIRTTLPPKRGRGFLAIFQM